MQTEMKNYLPNQYFGVLLSMAALTRLLDAGLVWRLGVCSGRDSSDQPVCLSGVDAIDKALPAGGLHLEGLHEFALKTPQNTIPIELAAVTWMTNLAMQAWRQRFSDGRNTVVFVGQPVFPSAFLIDSLWCTIREDGQDETLGDDDKWTEHMLFLDPQSESAFDRCVEVCLECPEIAAIVIADINHPRPPQARMATTRRWQQRAQAAGQFVLVATSSKAIAQPSAAVSRWMLQPKGTIEGMPQWTIELLRIKGPQPTIAPPWRWLLQGSYENAHDPLSIHLAPVLDRRALRFPTPTERQRTNPYVGVG